MLRVKSLDDIKYMEINPEKERLKIAPNLKDTLYTYNSLPFNYETFPRYSGHPYIPRIEKFKACVGKVVYFFRDRKSGKDVNFPYYLVQIWNEIDPKYRDILLMHELSSMQHMAIGKQSQRAAHERAKRKTKKYLKKYLKPKEIKEFWEMLKSLEKKSKYL